MIRLASSLLATLGAISTVSAHASIYHPSMYGFNVTAETFGRDFRPHVPLDHELFKDWWFHGHLDYPPHDGDVFELPAGGTAVAEIACHKSATSYWNTSESLKDGRQGNYPCPGQPLAAFHTTGRDGVTGCAMAIVDKANVHDIKPEDFTIFSVNHACVWTRDTEFPVPAKMPACKDGVCHCAWFWIHSPNSGSMQMYMTGFKCKVTNTNESARKIGKPSLARRCHDPEIGFDEKNCTVGPKQPLYWYQKEGNTFFEDTYHPPLYNDLYDFKHVSEYPAHYFDDTLDWCSLSYSFVFS
ncbi:hypothetical protein FRC03_004584 [Tulasnella sp. 419]|nr:hypothetical protein FRC03_004584 [Tulasnella sp. 419]